MFIDADKEVDKLIASIAGRNPPQSKYTKKEDKNNKKYIKNPAPLWYLEK